MRILHVVPTYLPAYRYGGPIYSVHGLCRALSARGHDVRVFTTNVDGGSDSAVPLGRCVNMDGVQVWYFPATMPRRLFRSPAMAGSLADAVASADLVHLHSVFLWPTLAAAREAYRHGVPYVLSPRGMLVKDLVARKSRWLKTLWIELYERRSIACAAAVHATSEVEARELGRFGFSIRHLEVIPNGVDPPSNTDKQTLRVPNRVLYIGRLSWKKGLERLVAAMTFNEEAQLVIAGNDEEGYLWKLKRYIRECAQDDRVELRGPVAGDEKHRLLREASLFVLPSLSENFGNAALEAMALGCPVLVTPEVGVAESVRYSGGGVVCGGSPEVLGPRIRDLLAHRDALNAMGRRGAAYVRENCTWGAVAGRVEGLYQGLLTGRL